MLYHNAIYHMGERPLQILSNEFTLALLLSNVSIILFFTTFINIALFAHLVYEMVGDYFEEIMQICKSGDQTSTLDNFFHDQLI